MNSRVIIDSRLVILNEILFKLFNFVGDRIMQQIENRFESMNKLNILFDIPAPRVVLSFNVVHVMFPMYFNVLERKTILLWTFTTFD